MFRDSYVSLIPRLSPRPDENKNGVRGEPGDEAIVMSVTIVWSVTCNDQVADCVNWYVVWRPGDHAAVRQV